jgi:hypothetical protein
MARASLCSLTRCAAKLTLSVLCRTVQDLSVAAKQKQAQIMALARQTAEQGIGDNDLKRLQRQFDSNKATFVNIDQKQRFMKGEHAGLHCLSLVCSCLPCAQS